MPRFPANSRPTSAMLLALSGCLVYPGLRDERLAALDGCDELRDGQPWFVDRDGDGFGDDGLDPILACEAPPGRVGNDSDCEDDDPAIHPAEDERCDGLDNNCDGLVDDPSAVDAHHWFPDEDGDGYGDRTRERVTCDPSTDPSHIEVGGDCDDNDPTLSPAEDELCDGIDNNCDGVVDESTAVDASIWFPDADGDGYGDPDRPTPACAIPPGFLADDRDCDDADPLTHPGGADTALKDRDCSGSHGGLEIADAELSGASGERMGTVQAMVGDVNGDGWEDFASGAPGSEPYQLGAVWLVLGGSGPSEGPMAGAGIRIDGEDAEDLAGSAVAGGGDFDGDGYNDIAVGAPAAVANRGSAYVLRGGPAGTIGHLAGALELRGEASGDLAGAAVALGELSGDGFSDLVVGSPNRGGGVVYVALGMTGAVQEGYLADAQAAFTGPVGSHAGHAVATVGDVDGDGVGDLLIGAPDDPSAGPDHGAAYLLLGRAAWSSASLDTVADALLTGVAPGDEAGTAVAGVGDVDGDGYRDLLVGALDAQGVGAAYLIRGAATGVFNQSLGSADTTFTGPESGSKFGQTVSAAGDVNADGYDDFLVGAPRADGGYGVAFLQLGAPGLPGALDAAAMSVPLPGEAANNNAGTGISGAGDMNGDGYDDLVVGAPAHNHGALISAGATYLLYGGPL